MSSGLKFRGGKRARIECSKDVYKNKIRNKKKQKYNLKGYLEYLEKKWEYKK